MLFFSILLPLKVSHHDHIRHIELDLGFGIAFSHDTNITALKQLICTLST